MMDIIAETIGADEQIDNVAEILLENGADLEYGLLVLSDRRILLSDLTGNLYRSTGRLDRIRRFIQKYEKLSVQIEKIIEELGAA